MSAKPRERKTTYDQAMEKSWPHAGFLVELMDSVAKSKRERVTVKALRLSRDVIDQDLAKLRAKRAIIDAKILIECSHPPEHLSVTETDTNVGSKVVSTKFTVACGCCGRELRHHTREH